MYLLIVVYVYNLHDDKMNTVFYCGPRSQTATLVMAEHISPLHGPQNTRLHISVNYRSPAAFSLVWFEDVCLLGSGAAVLSLMLSVTRCVFLACDSASRDMRQAFH